MEKLMDVKEKVGMAATVISNLLPGGEIQMTTTEVRGAEMRVLKNLPPALADIYRPWMKQYAAKTWVVYEEERYTFGEALQQMDALAAELASGFGLAAGQRGGIAMRNLPEFLIAFLGISVMGGVAVPLNALWKAEEMEYAFKDSGIKVVIGDVERLQMCVPFMSGLGVQPILVRGDAATASSIGAALWQDVLGRGKAKPPPSTKDIKAEDEAMIMYTSGSTGYPKGVVHTQRSVGTSMTVGSLLNKLRPIQDSAILLGVPLFHITALANVFLFSLPAGEKIVMMRKWDAGKAITLIETLKVTKFTGVPTMVRDILEHKDYQPERVASLRYFVAGGAPVPPSQVSSMRKKAKSVVPAQGYGLTETMGGCITNSGVDYLKHPTSCGKPIPFLVKVVIKDPATGKVLGDGARGEICIGGPLLMKGYNNRLEDTQKAIDEEGMFHTGDVGKIEGGFIYILDRLKDIIIRGGENIDCSEVEAAIYQHPAVRECCVFGLPDERLGEVVGAAVWLQGSPNPSPAELEGHSRKLLANFKVPEGANIFIHTEELPKGPTGKIAKKELRDEYSKVVKSRPPMSKL